MTKGSAFGPTGSLLLVAAPIRVASQMTTSPTRARAAHRPYCARSLTRLGSRGGLGGHARPRVCRSWATLVSCSLRNVPNSSPVAKASTQPRFSSSAFHAADSCILVKASIQTCLSSLGEAGGRHDATPVGELEVDALLLEGGHVLERLDPLGARHGEHADVAGLDLVEELTEAGGAEGDLVAEQRRQQLAAAVVRHVAHGLGVDADGLGELHRQQVVGAARRGAAADRRGSWGPSSRPRPAG